MGDKVKQRTTTDHHPHREPPSGPPGLQAQCDWLMTSKISPEEVKCSFPPPESPYEPRQVEGKINFFWNGLDPEDELAQNSKKRPKSGNFMCGFCYHWAATREELLDHMKKVHESKARFHVCKTCGKRYVARFLLQRHEAVHQYEPTLPHSRYVNSAGVPVKELVENHYLNGVRPANPTPETIADALATFTRIAETNPTCISCTKKFEDFGALSEHYEDVHASMYCRLCNNLERLYPTVTRLKQHLIDVHKLEYLNYFEQGHSKIWKRIEAEDRFKEIGGSFVNFFHSYAKAPSTLSWSESRRLAIDAFTENKRGQAESVTSDQGESDPGVPVGPDSPESLPDDVPESVSSPGDGVDAEVGVEADEEAEEAAVEVLPEETEPEVITVEEELRSGILSSRTRAAPRRACHVCKKLITYAAFKRHIDSHDELRFRCTELGCNKRFLTQSSLQLHCRAHSAERPFKCEHCPRAYNYGSLLKRHMRTHTGEMPYGCDMCGKWFHELVSLNYHRKKVHTGERPHKCDLCDKAFILAHDLKKHKNSHARMTIPQTQGEGLNKLAAPKKKRAGRISASDRARSLAGDNSPAGAEQRRMGTSQRVGFDEEDQLVHFEFIEEDEFEEALVVM